MEFTLVPVSLNAQDGVHLERAARCVRAVQDAISFLTATPQVFECHTVVPWPTELSTLASHGANVIGITFLPFEDNGFSHSTRGVSIISTAWAVCDTENRSSARALEKSAFERDGKLRVGDTSSLDCSFESVVAA